ncbi:MAG: flagellar protein FliT [Fervidobacterium sp.]
MDHEQIDILKIEEEIDKAIEDEDYEKLNELLDKRQQVLAFLSQETLGEIYERDKKRQEILAQKLNELKKMSKQIEEGKRMTNSYIQQNDKGQLFNSKG